MTMCETYCSHGGVCELERGHEGQHDSRYCQWTDDEALSRDEANEVLSRTPGGSLTALIWEATIPRDRDPE